MPSDQIIFPAADIASLCAACELARRGERVRMQALPPSAHVRIGTFTFDTGSAVIAGPRPLLDIFTRAGRNASDYFRLFPLDPHPRFWLADNVMIDMHRRSEVFAHLLNQQFPQDDLFTHYSRFLADPCEAPAVPRRPVRDMCSFLAANPHLARGDLFYPMGGCRAVSAALERLACELGVEFALSPHAAREVSTAQPRNAVFFLGLKRRYQHLTLYNIFLDPSSAIPHFEITAPCLIDPQHAPLHGDALRVTIPIPAHAPCDLPALRTVLFTTLKTRGMPDLENRIVVEHAAILAAAPAAARWNISGQLFASATFPPADLTAAATAAVSAANRSHAPHVPMPV